MDQPTGRTTSLKSTPIYTAPEILQNLIKHEQHGGNSEEARASTSDVDEKNESTDDDPGGRKTTMQGDVYGFAMTALEVSS